MLIATRDLKAMLKQAWSEGFKAAEDNDCCGCNLSIDGDGNEVVNPYAEKP